MAQVTSNRLSSDPGPQYDETFREAIELLQKAADQWALGHPEEPPTSDVLKEILELFRKKGFLKRPY
jgi:hypothetical protein